MSPSVYYVKHKSPKKALNYWISLTSESSKAWFTAGFMRSQHMATLMLMHSLCTFTGNFNQQSFFICACISSNLLLCHHYGNLVANLLQYFMSNFTRFFNKLSVPLVIFVCFKVTTRLLLMDTFLWQIIWSLSWEIFFSI